MKSDILYCQTFTINLFLYTYRHSIMCFKYKSSFLILHINACQIKSHFIKYLNKRVTSVLGNKMAVRALICFNIEIVSNGVSWAQLCLGNDQAENID